MAGRYADAAGLQRRTMSWIDDLAKTQVRLAQADVDRERRSADWTPRQQLN
jgi:hypothetical protein